MARPAPRRFWWVKCGPRCRSSTRLPKGLPCTRMPGSLSAVYCPTHRLRSGATGMSPVGAGPCTPKTTRTRTSQDERERGKEREAETDGPRQTDRQTDRQTVQVRCAANGLEQPDAQPVSLAGSGSEACASRIRTPLWDELGTLQQHYAPRCLQT